MANEKDMLATAKQWAENGFAGELIYLEPGGKKPLQGFTGWTTATVTTEELLHKIKTQNCNIGLRTRYFHALDIEGTPWADKLVDFLVKRFPDIPIRTRQGSTSRAMLIRYNDPFDNPNVFWAKGGYSEEYVDTAGQTVRRKVFELLGRGGQLHVEGKRHDAGDVLLEWDREVIADKLPVLDYYEIAQLFNDVGDFLRQEGANLTSATSGERKAMTSLHEKERADIKTITKLMGLIPNGKEFVDREAWVELCHGLYGASDGSLEAKDLWLDWCAQVPQGIEGEPERVWNTINPANVRAGVGVLTKWAQQINPQGVAALDFEDMQDEEQIVQTNPNTNAPRWLAKDVMRRACMEDRSARQAIGPVRRYQDFALRASVLSKPPAIIPGFAYPGIVHGIIAAPGVGKSLWALRQLLSGVLGDGGIEKPHVFALFGEDSEAIIVERGVAAETSILAGAGGATPADPTRAFEPVTNQPLDLFRWEEKTKRIEKAITRGLHHVCDVLESILAGAGGLDNTKPIVLVFDMMRHVFSGDDNDRKQIDALFRVWKAIMAAVEQAGGPPVGIVFTHHATKQASRKAETGFSSAGSIGIEGNSRMITEMRTVGDDGRYVELIVSKTNYGVTGEKTYYRKDQVQSPLQGGGQTVVLVPVDKSEVFAGSNIDKLLVDRIVQGLWKAQTAGGALPPSVGLKSARGLPSLRQAVEDLAIGQTVTEDELRAVLKRGIDVGALAEGRYRDSKRGVDCKGALVAVDGWKGFDIGSDNIP